MIKNKTINYLELPANDFEAIQDFYGTIFNWSFVSYGSEYLAFNDGNMDGGFYQSELCSKADKGSALIVIYSENLEQLQQLILDSGGSIIKQIFSFPGGRRFHFTDPAGNELAVWSDI